MEKLPPPPRRDPALVEALRSALDRAGFDRRVTRAIASGEPHGLDGLDRDAATLARLFVLAETIAVREADAALSPLGVAGAVRLGVAASDGTDCRATVRIVPYDIVRIASDLPSETLAPDHVASSHRPSATLANLTVRRHAVHALDIGTGNGIQALLLARHADRVVATDVSERALRFAEFNALLDGAANVETRGGSFLEPAAGERFDLVTCNPPYPVTPASGILYRDAGLRGDVLCGQLVGALPGLLEDAGFATMLVSWVPYYGQDELAAPLEWITAAGCRGVVFHLHSESAYEAATSWVEEGSVELTEWLAWYEAEGIDRIAYGAVVLQRRDGAAPWADAIELPGGPLGPAGDQLERIFAARDALDDEPPEELRLAPAPDVELTRAGARLELALRGGLGLEAGLEPEAAALVDELARGRTVAEALGAAAIDPGDGRELLRRLAGCGFLLPAD